MFFLFVWTRIAKGCRNLQRLSLNSASNCDALVKQLFECHSLEDLDLNNSDVSRSCVEKFEAAIPNCSVGTMNCFDEDD